jgi:uncharacterized membrane protein
MQKQNIRTMVQLSFLVAIELIMAFTPLGSLPIGPLVATLAHIPVVIAAVVMGTGAGAFMGFVFGLLSFLVWTFMPPTPITAFCFTPAYAPGNFWSVAICFVPRILLGVIAGLLSKALLKVDKTKGFIAYTVSSVVATIAHTLMVLGGIYVFFGEAYAEAIGVGHELLMGLIGTTIATNGILEAVLAGVITCAIAKAVSSYGMKAKKAN